MKVSSLRMAIVSALVLSALALLPTCQDPGKPPVTMVHTAITPVPLPVNIVPGFKFPEDTATIINKWLGGYTAPYFDTVDIYKHAWGIWAGLTAKSGQQYNGQDVLVFETWPGITDIQSLINQGNKQAVFSRPGRPKLTRPHQFGHARLHAHALGIPMAVDSVNEEENNDLWVAVTYDPTAAAHAVSNRLLDSNYLKSMIEPGKIKSIPPFPNTAITLKPTFLIGHIKDDTIKIPAWAGPPHPAMNFPDTMWNSWVYVNLKNPQPSNRKLIPVHDGNPTPAEIAAATANLGDFIYYTLDSAAAAYLNQQESSQGVKAQKGDVMLLVAMHVTTKEISNWTWQTFFWAPDPDNPPFPSDAVAAGTRPRQLSAAASHYALSATYAMVRPNQPISGGTNKNVSPVIGYNPYLEPNLGAINNPKNNPNHLNPGFMWGVQSNCMSCHAQAYYPPNFIYTADQYVDMKDGKFYNGTVQLDFAWSIVGNLTGGPAK